MTAAEGAACPVPNLLEAGRPVDIASVPLAHQPVSAEQDGGGAPTTGGQPLGRLADAEVGVWELSAGTMHDVEAEEVFVVTAGRGSLIIEPFAELPEQRAELFPGAVVRLSEGMRTTWIVAETLRKFYVVPRSSQSDTQNSGAPE